MQVPGVTNTMLTQTTGPSLQHMCKHTWSLSTHLKAQLRTLEGSPDPKSALSRTYDEDETITC